MPKTGRKIPVKVLSTLTRSEKLFYVPYIAYPYFRYQSVFFFFSIFSPEMQCIQQISSLYVPVAVYILLNLGAMLNHV